MAKKKTGKNTQKSYVSEDRWRKNRKARLERHMKKHPNDEQTKKALDGVSKAEYNRDEFRGAKQSKTQIYLKRLYAIFRRRQLPEPKWLIQNTDPKIAKRKVTNG